MACQELSAAVGASIALVTDGVRGTERMMSRKPQGRRWILLRGASIAAALAFVMLVGTPALAQRKLVAQGRTASAAAEDTGDKVFVSPDRDMIKMLARSRKLLAEGRFGEAVRNLDAILEKLERGQTSEGSGDFFLEPDKTSARSRGLRAEVQDLIGQMPPEGRELYELQYGARARQMLSDALDTGDIKNMSEVSRRYFHTRSGYEATFLLGLHHFDHGRPLAGALSLRRLFETGESMEEFEPALSLTIAACWLQAGMADKAREVLVALRERHPSLRVKVAGRETPIFAHKAQAVEWLVELIGEQPTVLAAELDNWLMFRGDACRNASMAGSAPLLNMRWRVVSTDDPKAENELEQCQKMYSEFGSPTIPAFHPLAVGDVLLMRTMQNLLAVDLATGKRLWEVPVDEPGEPSGDAAELPLRRTLLLSGAGQRIWNDLTYGTLSSDGRYVFSVEDAESSAGASGSLRGNVVLGGGVGRVRRLANGRLVVFNLVGGRGEQQSLSNHLTAHEIRTGKLKWRIGGPSGAHALRQPDTLFLGPPLPLQGQLYVLTEVKGEVRLLVLEAATGDVLWSQQLASTEQDSQQDSSRHECGVSPSYADGVLVCPTSAGAVVGVELATRSLLWGHSFNQDQEGGRRNFRVAGGAGFVVTNVNGEPSATRWCDDSVSISEGRVLATPLDSDWLFCLSLIDGELLWKQHRKDGLYVACADREKVVVIGGREVRAFRLTDGKPSWGGRVVKLPENSSPSGRGFASGNLYFLPLSSAEVAVIDLAAAKIVRVCKSRKGTVPGNLVCFKGNIISQGLEGVDAYYQRDTVSTEVSRRLAANANDAEALSLQGEILLDEGKRSEAVASFRRAYRLASDARSRVLLRDCLLDGLGTEFAAYRGDVAEIERLLDDPPQRAAFLRAMVTGLRRAGELGAAFDACQKLADLEPNQRPLDPIGKSLVVRRDRWVRGQLAELRRKAKDEAAAKIDQAVAARFQSARATTSVEPLQRFFDGFGDQPAAAQTRDEVVRRLNNAGRRIEAELTAPPPPDVPSRDAGERRTVWPTGKIEVATAPTRNTPHNYYSRSVLSLRGDPGPFFRNLPIQFDYNRRTMMACDSFGREQWKILLAESGQNQGYSYSSSLTYGGADGHLLVLSLGWKIVAVDALGLGPNGTPRVLWMQDLLGRALDPNDDSPQQVVNMHWQLQQQFAQIHDQSKILGPVRHGYVCFQRFRSLVAVDPRNGETLWIRQDVPMNSDVFGDDEYVFVLPPDSDEARVLRACDGETVGTRKVPRVGRQQVLPGGERRTVFGRLDETCLATLGRNMLLWWPEGNQCTLTLVDPLEGRDLWRGRKFSSSARACVVNDEMVGVMEPNGRFALVSLPDGRTIADLKLEPESSLSELTVFASGDQYFVLTRSSEGEGNSQFQPMAGCLHKPIHQGRLYAVDRKGKLQWPAPAKIKNQYIMASQPAELPVLTFASLAYEQKPNGQSRYRTSIRCIDKRNGKTAFRKKYENATGIFHVSGDAAKKTVDLVMQQSTVTLTFTDKPIPPAPAKGKASRGDKTVRALWNSVQKFLGRGDDDSEDEE
jgi:outer membrane protein assembly factor BamB/tetratricopeptide (TPR) repeat protein